MGPITRVALAIMGGASMKQAALHALGTPPISPAYDAAPILGRRNFFWQPTSEAANSILHGSLDSLRRKSRDADRRMPWSRRSHRSYAANVIGTGIRPMSQHQDPEMRKMLQKAWTKWTKCADLTGVTDYYGLQTMAVKNQRVAGEVFGRYVVIPDAPRGQCPLRIQLIEADQVDSTRNEPMADGGKIIQGIEFDPLGRKVAYHVFRDHPGEAVQSSVSSEIMRIPVADMFQLFEPDRPGQAHGVPTLSAVLLRMVDFEEFEDAELVARRDRSKFSGFIQEAETGKPIIPGEEATDKVSGSAIEVAQLEPGTFQKLRPGEEVQFPDQGSLGDTYEAWVVWVLRALAAAGDNTYEQMTGDHTKVNFSSIRANLIEIRRIMEQYQNQTVNFQQNQPTWNRWLQESVLAGAIDVSPRQYLREQESLEEVLWMPQGWEWVDVLKEVEAKIRARDAGLTSRAELVSQTGRDVEAVDDELAADQKRADDLGLVFRNDPRIAAEAASAGGGAGGSRGTGDDDDNVRVA